MTTYQLILTISTVATAGNYGPISMKTISSNVLGERDNAIVYDSNPTFGNIQISGVPAELTLTTQKIGDDETNSYIGNQFNGEVSITSSLLYFKLLVGGAN